MGALAVVIVAAAASCAAHGSGEASRAVSAAPSAPAIASPLEVTRAFYAALHGLDAGAAARLVQPSSTGAATEAFVELSRAYRDLEQVVGARFGKDAARVVGYEERVSAEDRALEGAREQVQGDDATVTAGDRVLATLHRVDGAWRIVLEEALGTERGVATLSAEAQASRRAEARVAPAIRAGLFDSAEDALEAFRNDVELQLQEASPELPASPDEREPGPGASPL